MNGLVYNLHNHTPFSDGAYSIDELCEAHLDMKDVRVDGIGISDDLFRTPTSREPGDERDFERLFGNETRAYVESVQDARQRWAGKLRIFCGAEINWPLNKNMLNCIKTMLEGLDYVLFGYVDWAGLTTLANQVRRWPCLVGLSHTRIAERFPNTSQDQIVRTMANARMFYEANSAYMPFAPADPWFKLLPNHRVAVAIGTDTHDDLSCLKQIKPMCDYLHQRGLHEKMLKFADRQQQVLSA